MIRARSWGPEHVHPRCNCLCRSDFAAWAGEGRSGVAGTTGEPFDEPTTQKRPALRVAWGRAPASLRRSTDVTASLFAARLADRLARTQRRLFLYERNMLSMKARVFVTLKNGVLDPQGKA